MKNKFFINLLLLTALVVAGVAAYFSVFGLSKLFAGAMLAAIIMASSLELGKLILSSYLYRLWDSISKFRRVYGVIAVGVLMLITSVGIYGFLSNAFESTSIQVEQLDSKLEIVDTRIGSKEQEKGRYVQLIVDKQDRINTLTNLRKQQEVRLDSLLANEHWINASRTTTSIQNADNEIGKLYSEIDGLNVKLDSTNSNIIGLKTERLNHNVTSDLTGEVGPLRYISRLLNTSMDRVVNWIILLLIFVFDPLAIYLILSYNHLIIKYKKEDDEEESVSNSPLPVLNETPVKLTEETTDEVEVEVETPVLKDTVEKKKLFDKYKDFKKKIEVKKKKKNKTTRMSSSGAIEYYDKNE